MPFCFRGAIFPGQEEQALIPYDGLWFGCDDPRNVWMSGIHQGVGLGACNDRRRDQDHGATFHQPAVAEVTRDLRGWIKDKSGCAAVLAARAPKLVTRQKRPSLPSPARSSRRTMYRLDANEY